MNKISCDMCLDLMPLVRDGVAGPDSRAAVEAHIADCESCRAVFEQGSPECDNEKALRKTINHVQRVCKAVLIGVVLLGIVLCEMVMQGSSMIFVLLCWIIFALARFALRRDKGWFRRIASLCLAVALAAGLCALGNAMFGNPVSRNLAKKAAENYLAGKFPEDGYEILDVHFDAKRGHYEVEVGKTGSRDIRFFVDTDGKGNFHHDTYDNVLTGWNTANALEKAYAEQAEPLLAKLNLAWGHVNTSCTLEFEYRQWKDDPYAFQYFLEGEALVPDGEYDLQELGKLVGKLSVTVESDTVEADYAAQILLTVRQLMDEAGVTFRSVDLVLRYPMPENGTGRRPEGRIELEGFLYEDIRETGLTQRVIDANEA